MKITTDTNRQGECTARIIAWLQQCFDMIQSGSKLSPDPFYGRGDVLTSEVVKSVLDAIEGIFVSEMTRYPGYHRTAQGISESEVLAPPGFDKLDATQALAVCQGIDRIMQDYREEPSAVEAVE